MAAYMVTQDGAFFAVRLGDSRGPVIATFSNAMAAETFAEKQRLKDEGSPRVLGWLRHAGYGKYYIEAVAFAQVDVFERPVPT